MKNYNKGLIFSLLYCVVLALADVLISIRTQEFSVFNIGFYTFLISGSFFFVLSVIKYGNDWTKKIISHYKIHALWLNFHTFNSWMGAFVSLKYLTPSIATAMGMLLVPFFSLWHVRAQKPKRSLYALIIFIFFVTLSLSFYEYQNAVRPFDFALGMIGVILTAHGGAYSMIYSKVFLDHGFSKYSTLSLRFVLPATICLFFMDYSNLIIFRDLDIVLEFLFFIIIISIIPLSILIKAISYMPVANLSLIVANVPLLTYFFQYALKDKYEFDYENFLLIIVTSILLFYSALKKDFK